MGGGALCNPWKIIEDFVFPLNAFNYIYNYMAESAIILYLECLLGLISHFKILGQRDLSKKKYMKICKNCILNF